MSTPFLGAIFGFNLVDLVILALVAFSAARGLKVGATIQLGSYIGFWVGLLAGAVIAPYAAAPLPVGIVRTFISLVILFGLASITSALGRSLGSRISRKLDRFHLGKIDGGAGVIVSIAATLLIVWIVAALALNAPFQALSSEVSGSRIVQALDEILPPAPSVFAQVDALFSTAGFPPVFASIPPALAGPVPLPTSTEVKAIEAKVSASVLKVEGLACSEIQEGSAFVVAPGYVATNAHVVAGEPSTYVIQNGSQLAATVIWYNPHLDLAVLKVPGLQAPVLHFDTQVQPRGTQAVVLGYPEGGPLTYGSAGIMAGFDATGRDIYNKGLTTRLVYEIDAIVRPGNSGGPLVNSAGQVLGVVFSRSTTNNYVGFALAAPAVAKEVHEALTEPQHRVSTEGCVP
ncbi:MAG: MarP family serine protease [Ferrimicrobium sp.]|uniref:MarP family serine protease n=1 Tax=Ferrimicrobium sp. TaxID=2926050 RepID=UPI00261BCC8A|nr:MarP family serine protease [Ferrimicrobium sp.]